MPTMDDLTNLVSSKLTSNNQRLPHPLKDGDESGQFGDNIELWMTYLSQSQPWLDEVENQSNRAIVGFIRRYVREIIDDCTNSTLAIEAPGFQEKTITMPEWLQSLITAWHERRAVVITLNYDTLVERAAGAVIQANERSNLWMSELYPPYLQNIRARSQSIVSPTSVDTFQYCKLHGSANWYYSGNYEFFGETIYFSYVSPWGTMEESRLGEYERESKRLADDKEPLIIPPVMEKSSYFNNETVRRIWRQAGSGLEAATRVFVMGYSLPITDLGMEFFLKHSLPKNSATWYIINLDDHVKCRFEELLEPYRQTMNSDYIHKSTPVQEFVDDYINL